MKRPETISAGLLVAGLSVFLLGEDVERKPVVVEPPEPVRIPPASPPPEPPPPEPAPAPRFRVSVPGPMRLRLSLPQEVPPNLPAPDEDESVQQRLESYLRDLGARWTAQRGLPHRSWQVLAGHIEKQWRPGTSRIRDERIVGPSVARVGAEIWQRMLTAPPSVGDTFQDPADNPVYSDRGDWVPYWLPDPGDGDEDDALPEDPLLEKPRYNDVLALVEVRFGGTGEPEGGARLIESSGHPLYDRAALEGVERAVREWRNEPPPPGPARAVYALRGRVEVKSMLPVFGLGIDLLLPLLDPIVPAETTLSTRVDLVALHRLRNP